MKKSNMIIVILTLALLLYCNTIGVFAEVDFLTEPEDDETFLDIEHASQNITPLQSVPIKGYIRCFDVNEQGMIVVGTGMFSNNKICIYNSDGEYQYGFDYYSTGSYAVGWNGENILIYSVRGNLVTEVTSNGEVISVLKIKETDDIHSRWNYVQYSKKKVVGEVTYKRTVFKITKIDELGQKIIVYRASPLKMIIIIFTMMIIVTFIIGVVIYSIFYFKKMQEDYSISKQCQQCRNERTKKEDRLTIKSQV